jgi:hypothetical protein
VEWIAEVMVVWWSMVDCAKEQVWGRATVNRFDTHNTERDPHDYLGDLSPPPRLADTLPL